MTFKRKVEAFDDEVKFKLGQRVKVDWKIKEKHLRPPCNTGVIKNAYTWFYATPSHRKIVYAVALDEVAFSEMYWQINQDQLTLIEKRD